MLIAFPDPHNAPIKLSLPPTDGSVVQPFNVNMELLLFFAATITGIAASDLRSGSRDLDLPWGGFTPFQRNVNAGDNNKPWWGPSRSSQAEEYPELRSQLYQGDILLPDNEQDSRNAIKVKKYLWKNGVIPYRFAPGNFTEGMAKTVVEAMQVIENKTCVRFVEYEAQRELVEIRSLPNRGCYAVIGRRPGKKVVPMNLQYPECFHSRGIIEHELLHVVGLFHEQARKDRDQHVNIHWENIEKTYWSEFSKLTTNEVSTFDMPYDYRSIMHYPTWAFTKNGKSTITAKGHPNMELGQKDGPTNNDIQKVLRMYNCNRNK